MVPVTRMTPGQTSRFLFFRDVNRDHGLLREDHLSQGQIRTPPLSPESSESLGGKLGLAKHLLLGFNTNKSLSLRILGPSLEGVEPSITRFVPQNPCFVSDVDL